MDYMVGIILMETWYVIHQKLHTKEKAAIFGLFIMNHLWDKMSFKEDHLVPKFNIGLQTILFINSHMQMMSLLKNVIREELKLCSDKNWLKFISINIKKKLLFLKTLRLVQLLKLHSLMQTLTQIQFLINH